MARKIGDSAAGTPEATQPPETVFEATPAGPSAGLEQTQAKMKANMDKTIKAAEELVAFGQGNLEAWAKASQIWVAGVQDLTRTVAATAQAQLDETLATVKALAAAKSLKEAVELQTTLARASVEKAVAETGKLTDAGLKLAEQAWAPLTARASLAVEKFSRPV
jgi:phasin family protein